MDRYRQASEYLRVLAHPLRLQILGILQQRRLSVGELATLCHAPGAAISGHLRLLRDRGLLRRERLGRRVFYRVAESEMAFLAACFNDVPRPRP